MHDSANIFVTGESGKTALERERVQVYDATTTFDKLVPLRSYDEHSDIITCLTHYPSMERLFFSGSRDCSVKLWDTRQPRSAGIPFFYRFLIFPATLGVFQQSTNRVVTHEGMVTCLDAHENILVSGGLDKQILIWDIRSLSTNKYSTPIRKILVDDFAVLKVAIGPSAASAAVSTLKGLYWVDFATGTAKPAVPFSDGRKMRRYHDLKWNNTHSILFAAGDDMRIDQFILK